MKNLKFTILLTAMMSVFFVSCDEDDVDMNPMNPIFTTVVDVVAGNPDLSILVEALTAADLLTTLGSETDKFTVLAPTNAAFAELLNLLGVSKAELLADPELVNYLLFHVIEGDVRAGDLSTGYSKTLNATGPNGTKPDLRIVVDGGVTFNGSSDVTLADQGADNGVVHVINKVMLAPDVVGLALSNNAFTSLVSALTAADNTTDFVSVLSGDGPFTVFAPTNDGFQALLDSNMDWDELSDIPVSVRDAVLKYHVTTAGNVLAGALVQDQEIPMLQGSNVVVDLTSGAQLKTGSGQTVDIIATDVQGTNGVIHVIERVLVPSL